MVLLLTKDEGTELDINGFVSTCFVSDSVLTEPSLLPGEYSRKVFLGL